MPTDYTLSDLVKLTGVSPRTVRYYIAQGLLPSPTQSGPAARYTDGHLDRLRLIKKLQAGHLPLAEIRNRLRALPDDELAQMAENMPAEPAPNSALDYIAGILGEAHPRYAEVAPAATTMSRAAMPMPRPSAPPPAAPAREPAKPEPNPEPEHAQPDRAQWERISLDPDVELHVRRPLTRQLNKRVERLISIARQLLEEE